MALRLLNEIRGMKNCMGCEKIMININHRSIFLTDHSEK